jgi:malate/lactate dehydrogenase
LPAESADEKDVLARFVARRGASVLNTAFTRCFKVLSGWRERAQRPARLNLVGLGDVGGTVLTGLKLLGAELANIGAFDPDEKKCARYEAELNQILPVSDMEVPPSVQIVPQAELFACDALLFTASRGVPAVGDEKNDVRMVQYRANRDMLRVYAKQARDSGFCGLFLQISDPVDHLCRAVFLMSNQNESGALDWKGLLPEQVRGFGLGVMRARANYCAQRDETGARDVCAFGPHGNGLVVANVPNDGYDDELSKRLTEQTETANLAIRKLGYKPYIAPGLSSAAISILRMLRGQWHDAAVPIGGVYFGCKTRLTKNGPETCRRPLNEQLYQRIQMSYGKLKEFDATWAD